MLQDTANADKFGQSVLPYWSPDQVPQAALVPKASLLLPSPYPYTPVDALVLDIPADVITYGVKTFVRLTNMSCFTDFGSKRSLCSI